MDLGLVEKDHKYIRNGYFICLHPNTPALVIGKSSVLADSMPTDLDKTPEPAATKFGTNPSRDSLLMDVPLSPKLDSSDYSSGHNRQSH